MVRSSSPAPLGEPSVSSCHFMYKLYLLPASSGQTTIAAFAHPWWILWACLLYKGVKRRLSRLCTRCFAASGIRLPSGAGAVCKEGDLSLARAKTKFVYFANHLNTEQQQGGRTAAELCDFPIQVDDFAGGHLLGTKRNEILCEMTQFSSACQTSGSI